MHKVIVVPVIGGKKKAGQQGMWRHVLVFFDPLLRPERGEVYMLTQQDAVQNSMIGIKTEGHDHLSLRGRETPADRVDLVLFVPNESHAKMDVKQKESPEGELRTLPGRKMTEEELAAYGPARIGFRPIGWTGEKLTAKDYFGAQFYVLQKVT